MTTSARLLLAFRPEHINAENASGRTPLEIATSNYLTKISQNPEILNLRGHQTSAILYQSSGFPALGGRAAEAAEDGETVNEKEWDTPDVNSAFELACKVAREAGCGRALVSLHEARSLVQRLQGSKDLPVTEEEEMVYKRQREVVGQFDPMWAVM